MYAARVNCGEIAATLQISDDYNPMQAEDALNQCRATVIALNDHLDKPVPTTAGLSHYAAMRRDLLQED